MAKKKRCATGYNLYIKKCSEDKAFGKCLTDKGWAKLSDKEKGKWNGTAKEQCDV
ncbi:hypothetical protein LCGC14_0949960 [marine sediment metagenome]|uniref:Uncharacterized protein n=1 Tax=marine sediment metagenome TaxID=412755 RepID=A0A0F9NMA6_9ZZZZ